MPILLLRSQKGLSEVSNDLIKSGPNQGDQPFIASNRFAWLVDKLLALVGNIAVERDSLNTGEFRAKLLDYRDEFSGHATGISLTDSAETCLALCDKYFREARGYEG